MRRTANVHHQNSGVFRVSTMDVICSVTVSKRLPGAMTGSDCPGLGRPCRVSLRSRRPSSTALPSTRGLDCEVRPDRWSAAGYSTPPTTRSSVFRAFSLATSISRIVYVAEDDRLRGASLLASGLDFAVADEAILDLRLEFPLRGCAARNRCISPSLRGCAPSRPDCAASSRFPLSQS